MIKKDDRSRRQYVSLDDYSGNTIKGNRMKGE